MAIYGNGFNSNYRPPHAGEFGNAVVFSGVAAVTTAPALADSIQPVFVPAGTLVHKVTIKNTDMDAGGSPALAAKIGFSPADGSATPSGADTAIASAANWAQSAVTTTYDILPPYMVEEDSMLNIVVTAAPATGATGTVYAVVTGEACGGK